VRTCVIFNPTAKGERANRFRRHLNEIATESTFKLTTAVGDGRRLATEAVKEGFRTIVAAGGDGTLNEVLNGIGDAPNGFEATRLGVLPLGTVNVFARELAIPLRLAEAWAVIRQGRETLIDLPKVICHSNGSPRQWYFAQLAGAGLDARAIELVQWELKKRIGPLAYVLAGIHAILGSPSRITASAGAQTAEGQLVLVGNGRLYGGQFSIFPNANLRDGLLEVCVFPRVDWATLARCSPHLLIRGRLPAKATTGLQTQTLTLTSTGQVPVEVDGELVGHLPATFSIEPSRLRVVVP